MKQLPAWRICNRKDVMNIFCIYAHRAGYSESLWSFVQKMHRPDSAIIREGFPAFSKDLFSPQPAQQKIIVATNIAETSLTIPGIKYVIDAGLARILEYNPRSQTTGLPIKPISLSSAEQRKGRCGRVQNGICIRLYSQEEFTQKPLYTPPEIMRSNLAGVILQMLSLNLGSVNSFPFVDRPQPKSIRDGIDILDDLGALTKDDNSEDTNLYKLTEVGWKMAEFPLDPRVSRMLIEA